MKGIMDKFSKMYEKPLTSNKVFLMKKLFNMQMSEGGSIFYHLNEFNIVTNKLQFMKLYFDDEVRVFCCYVHYYGVGTI